MFQTDNTAGSRWRWGDEREPSEQGLSEKMCGKEGPSAVIRSAVRAWGGLSEQGGSEEGLGGKGWGEGRGEMEQELMHENYDEGKGGV